MNTEEIIEGYMGSTEVNSIYQGSELIWPKYNYKYLIGGGFAHFNGNIQTRLVRLNNDGSKDTSFNIRNGFNNTVRSIVINNTNSKIYVGGDFFTFDGNTQNNLIRLNMNGSKDTSFNIGTGFVGDVSVNSIVIDDTNSKLYVGGSIISFNGTTQMSLIRLNMNGSLDTSFNTGIGYVVHALNLDTINQKLYVGGINNLARYNLNGTKDTSFNIGSGFDGGTGGGFTNGIYALNLDTINQKLYVGGSFTTFNGNTRNRLVRLNMNGSLDTSFNIGTGFGAGFGFGASVNSIIIDETISKIYVGGSFTTFNGSTQNRLVRLNMDGSLDTSFNIGTGFSGSVFSVDIDTINQKIYVGGTFTTFNNGTQNRLVRLNMDGSLDTSFNIGDGFDGGVTTILKYRV